MESNRNMKPSGDLKVKRIPAPFAPLDWRVRNVLRPSFLGGLLANRVARGFSRLTGIVTMRSVLEGRVARLDPRQRDEYMRLSLALGRKDEALAFLKTIKRQWINHGVLSYQVITDTGVAFVVDDWDDSTKDITNLHFHGIGTGTNAEAVGDTALQTESTTALNPDNTRATGTESQPSANILRTVGTLTADASIACTEHGIFDQSATGGGTLWDRSVFSVINLASGDSIQTTYSLTISSGG